MEAYKIINESSIKQIKQKSFDARHIHNLISMNLTEFNNSLLLFNEYSLQSSYSSSEASAGRIDTLSLGEELQPIVIEYRTAETKNVISQALYYMDWILSHKEAFEKLVVEKANKNPNDLQELSIKGVNGDRPFTIEEINWESSKIICIAKEFSKFETHSISHLKINTDLYVFDIFDDTLFINKKFSNNLKSTKKNTLSSLGRKEKYEKQHISFRIKNIPEKHRKMVEYLETSINEKLVGTEIVNTKYYRSVKRTKSIFTYYIPDMTSNEIHIYSNDDLAMRSDLFQEIDSGHWGIGKYKAVINSFSMVDKIIAVFQ